MTAFLDELWLLDVHPLATDDEIENFCERVAIKIDSGIDQGSARFQAHAEIICVTTK